MADETLLVGGDNDAATSAPHEIEKMFGVPVTDSSGQRVLHVARENYLAVVEAAKNDGFNMCIDVTVVDYLTWPENVPDATEQLGIEPQRFEVVTSLLNMDRKERIRIRVQIPANEPACPSIVRLYAGAENMEREAFDLLGVRFTGHPDLTRILLPEDWEGHPLRKDYGPTRIPVQFKAPLRSN